MKRVASGILPVIALDRKGPNALHRQIYDAYRAAILEGRLHPGQRIPSTRVLASEIGVSRFPVLNAYDQLLAEGYLEGRVGAGTVVSRSLPDRLTTSQVNGKPREDKRSGPSPVAKRISIFPRREARPWLECWGTFRVGQVAFDQFPLRIWTDLVARRCRQIDSRSAHYGDLTGSPALRRAIARYLNVARSVRCDAEQIVIVNGSQQALDMATRVLLDPGSQVWVEQPCYRLARDVFAMNACRPVPVPVDAEGLNVAAGIRKCRRARAAFVSPSHQFPLGVTMSASRRLQLIEWAQSAGAWIFEDDYDSEFRYESLPIASLQGLDANSRVIYIGTFSKVLFPSLRLGYLVIPPDLIELFRQIRLVMDLGTPTFHQDVLADFIDEGHFERHIRRMRVYYAKLRSALVDRINRDLGSLVKVVGDEAGMHVTVLLKKGLRDVDVATRAAHQNLSLWPLSPSYLGEPKQGFIMGFGGTTVEGIPGAVRKLRTLLTMR